MQKATQPKLFSFNTNSTTSTNRRKMAGKRTRKKKKKRKMQIYKLLPIETAVKRRSIFDTNKIPLPCKVKLKRSKKEDGSHLHLAVTPRRRTRSETKEKRMDERKVPKCLPPRPCRQLFFSPESDQPDLEKKNEVLCNVETVLKNVRVTIEAMHIIMLT